MSKGACWDLTCHCKWLAARAGRSWGPGGSTGEFGALDDPREGPRLGSMVGNRRRSQNVVEGLQILCILNISVNRRVTEIFKMHNICGTLATFGDRRRFPSGDPKQGGELVGFA